MVGIGASGVDSLINLSQATRGWNTLSLVLARVSTLQTWSTRNHHQPLLFVPSV